MQYIYGNITHFVAHLLERRNEKGKRLLEFNQSINELRLGTGQLDPKSTSLCCVSDGPMKSFCQNVNILLTDDLKGE